MNDILGQSKKQNETKEIKLPESVISKEELADVCNEHFINSDVQIWLRLFKMKMLVLFRTLLTNKILNLLFKSNWRR